MFSDWVFSLTCHMIAISTLESMIKCFECNANLKKKKKYKGDLNLQNNSGYVFFFQNEIHI